MFSLLILCITKGCTGHVGKGRGPEDAPGPQDVCHWSSLNLSFTERSSKYGEF